MLSLIKCISAVTWSAASSRPKLADESAYGQKRLPGASAQNANRGLPWVQMVYSVAQRSGYVWILPRFSMVSLAHKEEFNTGECV
jgi:hypothetical protein